MRFGPFILFGWLIHFSSGATDTADLIYSTGFEPTEGYDRQLTLVGQAGWIGEGTGGNGLLIDFFEGFGQQAYIGFNPPLQREEALNVWRPINLAPVPADRPVVTFSVRMQIVDSTNQRNDDFRWSVYNTNGIRLFSLDFDTSARSVNYLLDDDSGFVATGFSFASDGFYDLAISMNFARNLWSASMNDVLRVVNSLPITTKNSALNLGDIDAVWAIRDPAAPGNNYLVFDDYQIRAEAAQSIAPRLEAIGLLNDGRFHLKLMGEPGQEYGLEASSNLVQWALIRSGIASQPDGLLTFSDTFATSLPPRFYRAKHLP